VKQKLQENNIEFSQLLEFPVDNCPKWEFKKSDEVTSTENDEGK
jgi:hypothetical protein